MLILLHGMGASQDRHENPKEAVGLGDYIPFKQRAINRGEETRQRKGVLVHRGGKLWEHD